mgnify:CR=1 FL=1
MIIKKVFDIIYYCINFFNNIVYIFYPMTIQTILAPLIGVESIDFLIKKKSLLNENFSINYIFIAAFFLFFYLAIFSAYLTNFIKIINKNNTLFILDWDDTLFPTSWFIHNNINLHNSYMRNLYISYFIELDNVLYKLLKKLIKPLKFR